MCQDCALEIPRPVPQGTNSCLWVTGKTFHNKVHYQSGKCTFQLEIENAFHLWELVSLLTNKIASNHSTFSTRNSSPFPPMRTGRFLSENDLSGKDQSVSAYLRIQWNSWLSSPISYTWMRPENFLCTSLQPISLRWWATYWDGSQPTCSFNDYMNCSQAFRTAVIVFGNDKWNV